MDTLAILEDKSGLRKELQRFVTDWESGNNILPEFKVLTNDYRDFFSELSVWFKQIDMGVHNLYQENLDETLAELVDEVAEPIRPKKFAPLWSSWKR